MTGFSESWVVSCRIILATASAILCKSAAARDGATLDKGTTLLEEDDIVAADEMAAVAYATDDVTAREASVDDGTGTLKVFIITSR